MAISKSYDPKTCETQIYKVWEDNKLFKPSKISKYDKLFTVTLPPPNANANLHIGHALDFQIKDIIARHKRLNGYEVLLIPGADHAGFETWAVYEKHLNEAGKSRFDFSRDELYDQVFKFVADNRSKMENQIRKLGISCSWDDFTFTLDNKIIQASYQAFKKMWDQGLIYRAKRLVNYCTQHQTAFADIEVIHKDIEGHLWYIDYPIESGGIITVATTRPETMLGDTAVAVNPEDKRYRHFIGKTVRLPLSNRLIPIIADNDIKQDFGTGAVKITPACDFLDFEIANRHNLKAVEIIDSSGKLTNLVPLKYRDLTILEAKKMVIDDLKNIKLLKKQEPHKHPVGHCYKCQTILEPLLKDQWFVKMKPLVKKASKLLKQGEIKFYPAKKLDELISYWQGIQDWNISRQIAWGIPIPVFQNTDDLKDWIYNENVSQKTITLNGKTYKRDPDVFDTWWSSGQWAYASLNYPNNEEYYPSDLMETGVDILKPWVSRMIILSLFVTNKLPFKEVYLHGMIIDESGVKMSKSKGNVKNPMDIIESHGADALRIGLISGITPGQPQSFGINKLTMGRNFCNKIWNIGRLFQLITQGKLTDLAEVKPINSYDHYILDRFYETKNKVDQYLNDYKLNLAFEEVYNFIWHDLADWYLETVKIKTNISVLNYIFKNSLRLIHPWTPFISEALYQEIYNNNDFLINSKYTSNVIVTDIKQVNKFKNIKNIITETRQILEAELRYQAEIYLDNNDLLDNDSCDIVSKLLKVKAVKQGKPKTINLKLKTIANVYIVIDKSVFKQKYNKLKNQLDQLNKSKQILENRLANDSYLKNAPRELILQSNTQLNNLKKDIATLELEINDLKNI